MSFTFPYRLKSESNLREHWTKKSKRHQNERILLTLALKQFECQLPARIKLTRIAPRSCDFDNLVSAFKNIRDVVSDLLIPGLAAGRADDDERLAFSYHQEKGKPKEYAIRIEIIPLQQNHSMPNKTLDSKKIEEIIHDCKKFLDVPDERFSEMSREDQIVWFASAADKLGQLKLVLNIPPNKTCVDIFGDPFPCQLNAI